MIKRKGDFQFKKNIERLKSSQSTLPINLGNLAKNHFLLGFRNKGGQTDNSKGGWRERKRPNRADKRTRTSRALLVDSGHLRRSILVRRKSWRYGIIVGTRGLLYAQIHNEGNSKKNIPQREFIGNSRELDKKIEKKIIKELDKVFK